MTKNALFFYINLSNNHHGLFPVPESHVSTQNHGRMKKMQRSVSKNVKKVCSKCITSDVYIVFTVFWDLLVTIFSVKNMIIINKFT